MSQVVFPVSNEPGKFIFYCPGCKVYHGIWTEGDGPIWEFDRDMTNPTVSPSILVTTDRGEDHIKSICHSFVKAGVIQFLSDCTHELAGQTVKLKPEDEYTI